MKKIHRVFALLMAAIMALGLITTAFAEPTIDPTKKASLSIYKYDITTAGNDGAWDAESYVSTGLHDDAVIDKLSEYAIQGVEFTYLRVADVTTSNELLDGQRQVGVLYGFDSSDRSNAVLSAIGLTAADAHKTENGINYFTSDVLNNKLSAALAANATNVKNALETAMKNGGVAMPETDATGHTSASNMEQGLYLVVETRVPENVTSTCNPFFVSLPMTTIDGAAWNYDVTVYPKNQTGNPDLEKTVREAKNSTGKNTGSLTDIQKPSCDPPKTSNHQGRDFRPLVVVQQFVAIGAGLCRQVDMTDFIQRREINAFHICFDLVIAERVTRLRNQADKCVLAVVKDNELMVAGVNRHCLATRGGIRPFMVFMGIIQRKAVDAHASLYPTVYGDGAEAFLLAARTPIIPEGEGTVVPYPIFRDTLP